ncbi:MAG: hypothetical protein KDD22_03195, partial [Bdellovibrionales bacterium]|nr:hypothetical protein [Bdellovibrionales bacterium]
RRIKSEACEHIFEEGKYHLRDKPLKEHKSKSSRPKPLGSVPAVAPPQTSTVQVQPKEEKQNDREPPRAAEFSQVPGPSPKTPPVACSANELMHELKRAYALILQEKEELILQLKDELADLKTLARILEDENQRLKENIAKVESIDHWLR